MRTIRTAALADKDIIAAVEAFRKMDL